MATVACRQVQEHDPVSTQSTPVSTQSTPVSTQPGPPAGARCSARADPADDVGSHCRLGGPARVHAQPARYTGAVVAHRMWVPERCCKASSSCFTAVWLVRPKAARWLRRRRSPRVSPTLHPRRVCVRWPLRELVQTHACAGNALGDVLPDDSHLHAGRRACACEESAPDTLRRPRPGAAFGGGAALSRYLRPHRVAVYTA